MAHPCFRHGRAPGRRLAEYDRRALAAGLGGAAVVAATVVLAGTAPAPADAGAASCGKAGYAYAGHQGTQRAHGIRARVRPVADPVVESGHVAAWVGLGGPGLGPNGSDAWLQVGLSAFRPERSSRLYYEVNRPGIGPVYREVIPSVAPGERHVVAVLETRRRDWWRVWVDGRPVSPPVHLPASSGRWYPVATAERWDGGRRSCNRFAYGFEHVAVATARAGRWRSFRAGHRFQDSGMRVIRVRPDAFTARTTLPPSG